MPQIYLDVDTALAEVPVNVMPLLDDTDFKTIENAVVYNAAGMALIWHFVTSAGVMTETAVTPTTAGLHDWTDQGASGSYALEIPASGGTINNDTEGYGWFTGVATGVLPWRGPIIGFRAAALNNALIDGGDLLNVNVTHVTDQSQTANDNGADINTLIANQGDWATATGFATSTKQDTMETTLNDVPTTAEFEARTVSNTAALALEDQFDGTGLTGDTYPSSQSQLSGLANVGSAVNRPAASYTLTTGTQSANLYTDTQALDAVRHTHTDAAGVMDLKYEFTIGSGTPSSVQITGYVTGSNDDLDVFGYDWVAAGWVQIGNIQGSSSTSNSVYSFDIFVNMVGSGANKGEVEIRFYKASGLSTATLAIDQIFVAYNQGADGYDLGMIWYDDSAANTNTVVGVDGISTNPVSTVAAVNTLIASTRLSRVNISPSSTFTLVADMEGCLLTGENWACVLAGYSISATIIENAVVSGIATGATRPKFRECSIGTVTLPPTAFDRCGRTGTITVGSAGDFDLVDCFSQIAGSGSPGFDMGSAIGASNVSFRRHAGGNSITNIQAGDVISAEATAGGTLTINGTGGNVEARGMWKQVVDSSGGSVAIDDKSITLDNINIESDTALTDYGPNTVVPTSAAAQTSQFSTTDGLINSKPTAIENRQEMDSSSTQLNTTLPAIIDDLAIKKNTSGLLHIEIVLTSDHVTPATGLTVTAQRLIDSGVYTAVSGTMTEISNGTYRFDYLAADANGDIITWRFSEATADDTKVTFKTVQ